jgi:hypothetical protein
MTLVTTLPARERLNNNLVTFFKQSLKDVQSSDTLLRRILKDDNLILIPENKVISVVALQVVPADRIIRRKRYFITFKLNDHFAKHFVLLSGILEFSRPKDIKVSRHKIARIFEVELSEMQAGRFSSYMQTILTWLIKEIKFKESLKDLIAFEKKVKQEQAILYSSVIDSLH